MKKPTKNPTMMPYNQRLRAYERDKDELLRTAAGLPRRSSRCCSIS